MGQNFMLINFGYVYRMWLNDETEPQKLLRLMSAHRNVDPQGIEKNENTNRFAAVSPSRGHWVPGFHSRIIWPLDTRHLNLDDSHTKHFKTPVLFELGYRWEKNNIHVHTYTFAFWPHFLIRHYLMVWNVGHIRTYSLVKCWSAVVLLVLQSTTGGEKYNFRFMRNCAKL